MDRRPEGPANEAGEASGRGDADTAVTEFLISPESRAHVGPYRLVEKLGEGGMGEVWLAEQAEPVRREVALKIIKRGMDTERVIARFEAERQALAMMDHPAIAHIHDAGATHDGRPYFAMEYVKGIPVTDHADTHRLGTQERLELFCQICEGVQHAHQKAILHRDLKPSNILVSLRDGKAQVKIIDFGLAKATAQRLTEKTMHTQIGAPMGTLEYMSPEQADLTGQGVDTRTDVYSLGVILYELLTGALPFDHDDLRAGGFAATQRRIRDQEPSRPSTRLSELGEERATAAARDRKTEPHKLARRLQGDLDWIVIRCLEKSPSRRYGSPQEIAADIRRHLADEPVLAGPPSFSYRTGKFVRRHVLGVVAAAVLIVGLVAGTVGATMGLMRARRAEAKAQFEAQSSETVTKVLTDLLAGLDPEAAGELLARDLRERVESHWRDQGRTEDEIAPLLAGLDRAMQGVNVTGTGLRMLDEMILSRSREPIDANLAERPQIAARLEHTVGTAYGRLGLTAQAEPHLLRAVELRHGALGPDAPETLHSMNNLAVLYWVQGRYDETEPLLLETVEVRKRVLGDDHPDALASLHNLATLYNVQGRYAEAEPLFLETFENQKRALGADHPNTLGSMNNLAVLYRVQGRYAEAERLFLETHEIQERALGADHPDTLGTTNNLAAVYADQGRYAEAEPLLSATFAAQKRVLGPDHPDALGTSNNLAALYVDQGRFDEAEPLLSETLATLERVLGGEHPETLRSRNLLGGLYTKTSRAEQAGPLLEEVLAERLRILGERHPHVGNSYYSLACLSAARANRGAALAQLRRALDLGWARASLLDDPMLEVLHGDPGFESLAAEVKERLGG